MTARRLRTVTALVAGLALLAPEALAANALLDAAGIVQKTLRRSCGFSGIGLPAPCPLTLPAAPAGRIMAVESLSCEVTTPTTVKSVDLTLSAPGQPVLFVPVERIADFGGKARYRSVGVQTLFVPEAAPVVSLTVPNVGITAQLACGFVGRHFAP